jgi:hypothetical protein
MGDMLAVEKINLHYGFAQALGGISIGAEMAGMPAFWAAMRWGRARSCAP